MHAKALLFLALLLLLTGCGGDDVDPAAGGGDETAAPSWGATIVFEAGQKLGGCAVGDVDPTHPGNEILAVAASGDIYVVRHDDQGWHGEVVATAGGEMIGCAIGDADPARPGLEAVVGGMLAGGEDAGGKGAAHLLYRDDAGWQLQPIYEDEALVHGVCIGDVDPGHDGDEVIGVGFSRKATILGRDSDAWKTLGQADLTSPGKNAVVFKGGVVVACSGGTVDWVAVEDGAWGNESAGTRFGGPARIDALGEQILVACDDGGLQLVEFEGSRQIHKEGQKLRGAVLADLDPSAPGQEAATAGYEKAMTVLYPPQAGEEAWTPVTVWRDTEKLHHLAAGELLADGQGLELVTVGYSGRVIVAARR